MLWKLVRWSSLKDRLQTSKYCYYCLNGEPLRHNSSFLLFLCCCSLRQSITVVGLLNETDKFFDMITARVGYVNTTLNAHVEGSKHSLKSNKESNRCKAIFQEPSFQAKLRERSPALAALDRLYHLAVQVNRHQLNELRQCADPSLKL
jgi:hypothetical protein